MFKESEPIIWKAPKKNRVVPHLQTGKNEFLPNNQTKIC